MKRSDIPFSALRSFEVAGRHLNFGKASRELGVSRSAISYQISSLEKHIECNLFEKIPTGIKLTDAGRRLLFLLTKSFDDVSDGLDKLKYGTVKEELHVGISEELFSGLFCDLIMELREAIPSVEFEFSSISNQYAQTYHKFDYIIVRRRDDDNFEQTSVKILDNILTPLCSPDISKNISNISDFSKFSLLKAEDELDWSRWFDLAGERRGPFSTVGSSNPAFSAVLAARGFGFALLSKFLFRQWIEDGRLVQPIPLEVDVGGYHLMQGRHQASTAGMRAFEEWIVEAAYRW